MALVSQLLLTLLVLLASPFVTTAAAEFTNSSRVLFKQDPGEALRSYEYFESGFQSGQYTPDATKKADSTPNDKHYRHASNNHYHEATRTARLLLQTGNATNAHCRYKIKF